MAMILPAPILAAHSSAPSDDWSSDPGASSPLTTLLHRYRVNVISSHRADDHAPVVHEINPTRANLVGWQEFGTHEGRPFTDHTMIKPGALHRANGGFLVLQASDLLRAPNAWDALKRALRFETISLDGGEPQGPVGASQRPEPIPTSVRVALIGDRATYFLLAEGDPEFRQLFKVHADFDVEMPRNTLTEQAYARYAGNVARTTGGAPLNAEAVALLIEEGSRWVERQDRLATVFGELRELTEEACYHARRAKSDTTTGEHVRQAIQARERRLSILADKYEQEIEEGRIFIHDGRRCCRAGERAYRRRYRRLQLQQTRAHHRAHRSRPVGVIDIEHESRSAGISTARASISSVAICVVATRRNSHSV